MKLPCHLLSPIPPRKAAFEPGAAAGHLPLTRIYNADNALRCLGRDATRGGTADHQGLAETPRADAGSRRADGRAPRHAKPDREVITVHRPDRHESADRDDQAYINILQGMKWRSLKHCGVIEKTGRG